MSDPGLLIVGRVRRAHGIRGELVVEPLTDAPDDVFSVGRRVFIGNGDAEPLPDAATLNISATRPFGKDILVKVQEVTDRTGAEQWHGRFLLMPAEELTPPDPQSAFLHELPGMRVVDEQNRERGTVVELYDLPQGLMLELTVPDGRLAMLPWHQDMIDRVDRDARVIHVRVPDGLLD